LIYQNTKLTLDGTTFSSDEEVLISILVKNLSTNVKGGLLAERGRSKFWFIPTDKHFCKRHARHGGKADEKYLRVASI
jgi:hypothetical protein